jgi:hypothetical protein
MNKLIGVCLMLVAITGYAGSRASNAQAVIASDYIVYRTGDTSYAIIYVNQANVSRSRAKKLAMRKAAEVGRANGYRFYTVENREDVTVGRSTGGRKAPRNIYQELIVEDDFGPSTSDDPIYYRGAGTRRGYKITVKYYRSNAPKDAVNIDRMLS